MASGKKYGSCWSFIAKVSVQAIEGTEPRSGRYLAGIK
tara:strand:- start:350 stop:463 length:114 start_codon:yes stop_codon:yes gene_type:complete